LQTIPGWQCPGCKNLSKSPKWFTISDCCIKNGYTNCTECIDFIDNNGCSKFEGMVIGCLKFLDGPERDVISKIIKEKGI
jgi:hypothetical protein